MPSLFFSTIGCFSTKQMELKQRNWFLTAMGDPLLQGFVIAFSAVIMLGPNCLH